MEREGFNLDDESNRDLHRWFDGEMSESEREAMESSIREDADLEQAAQFLDTVREEIRARPRITASAGFTDRVVRAVLPKAVSESPLVVLEPFVRGLAAAAMILFAISIGMWLFLDREPSDSLTAGPIRLSSVERALLGETVDGMDSMGRGAATSPVTR